MARKTKLSFEVFPPKKTSTINVIYEKLSQLCELNPEFISVTCGAGGGDLSGHTLGTAIKIKELGITPMAHLPCVNFTKAEVLEMLEKFKENGIHKILALRGDLPKDPSQIRNDFKYASDLITFIKNNGDFEIAAACYPETHYQAPDSKTDIENLKKKVDSGAQHLISQLFFDNGLFYEFIDKVRTKGINVPIAAGIMPITKKSQIQQIVSLCGASIPNNFSKIFQKFGDDEHALYSAGINYAAAQITDLIANDADEIHLYTMNNPAVARKIAESLGGLI